MTGHRIDPAALLGGLLDGLPIVEAPPTEAVESVVIGDWAPLDRSLERRLSALYWCGSGPRAFIEAQVPYVVNNSGWAAQSAADLLFACCEERAAAGWDGRFSALELGAGAGLFARQLLDSFASRCVDAGRDHHLKMTFYVTDISPRAVEWWREQGLFEPFGDRVVTAVCDGNRPTELLALDGSLVPVPQLVAVFANYALDSLPMAAVRRGPAGIEALQTRSVLTVSPEVLRGYTGLSVEELAAAAAADALEALLPIAQLLEIEASYRPTEHALPWVEAVLDGLPDGAPGLLSYGAARCLDALLDALDAGGFVLVNDYGPTQSADAHGLSFVQRFGQTVCSHVNFEFLKAHIEGAGGRVLAPLQDAERGVHSRLISAGDNPQTAAAFERIFSDPRLRSAERLTVDALAHSSAGRADLAGAAYRDHLGWCPTDWHALGQAAQFAYQQAGQPAVALDLVDAALAINPWTAPDLWNTRGTSLYALGRTAEALSAFEQALALDEGQPQAWLSVAICHIASDRLGDALLAIAKGLEHDLDGRFRSNLMHQQGLVCARLCSRHSEDRERLQRRHQALVGVTAGTR